MVESMLPDDSQNPIIFKFSTDMIPICLLSVRASESLQRLYKILDEEHSQSAGTCRRCRHEYDLRRSPSVRSMCMP